VSTIMDMLTKYSHYLLIGLNGRVLDLNGWVLSSELKKNSIKVFIHNIKYIFGYLTSLLKIQKFINTYQY